MMQRPIRPQRSVMLKRLMKLDVNSYNTRLAERWKELRASGIISNNNLNSHIERNDHIIRDQLERNFEKWPVNNPWYYDNNDYAMEIELMKKFVDLRIRQLDSVFITQ